MFTSRLCKASELNVYLKQYLNRCRTHHEEGVSVPQARPAEGAVWHSGVLAVQCDGCGGRFTHHTAADVIFNGSSVHRCTGESCRRRQPIGFIVPTGIRAGSHVTGRERHGGKDPHTRPCLTWKYLRHGQEVSYHYFKYTNQPQTLIILLQCKVLLENPGSRYSDTPHIQTPLQTSISTAHGYGTPDGSAPTAEQETLQHRMNYSGMIQGT